MSRRSTGSAANSPTARNSERSSLIGAHEENIGEGYLGRTVSDGEGRISILADPTKRTGWWDLW